MLSCKLRIPFFFFFFLFLQVRIFFFTHVTLFEFESFEWRFFSLVSQHGAIIVEKTYCILFPESDLFTLFVASLWNHWSSRESLKKLIKRKEKKGTTNNSGNLTLTREEASIYQEYRSMISIHKTTVKKFTSSLLSFRELRIPRVNLGQ